MFDFTQATSFNRTDKTPRIKRPQKKKKRKNNLESERVQRRCITPRAAIYLAACRFNVYRELITGSLCLSLYLPPSFHVGP